MERANSMISDFCESKDNLTFIDVYTPMIGSNGKPIPELFISDSLHMTAQGYQIWKEQIDPFIYK